MAKDSKSSENKKAKEIGKPKPMELPSDHPFIVAGYIHELQVLECFGLAWGTWCRDYRTRIPGYTFPSGRWYHTDDLRAWWTVFSGGKNAEDTGTDR